jgi:hypothetical protein
MKRASFALAAVILAGAAIPQDLPPGVLLLSRVKNHVREELQRLENISCIETIERERQPPKGKMRPLDTIRLEVLFNDDKNCMRRRATGNSRRSIRSATWGAAFWGLSTSEGTSAIFC